jgi:hypothetical protein
MGKSFGRDVGTKLLELLCQFLGEAGKLQIQRCLVSESTAGVKKSSEGCNLLLPKSSYSQNAPD